jgi:hypothetical protein
MVCFYAVFIAPTYNAHIQMKHDLANLECHCTECRNPRNFEIIRWWNMEGGGDFKFVPLLNTGKNNRQSFACYFSLYLTVANSPVWLVLRRHIT